MGDLYVKTALKRDQNGNVLIENNNVVLETLSEPKKVGSVLPSGNLGFRNDFNYKGINLGFMFSARLVELFFHRLRLLWISLAFLKQRL